MANIMVWEKHISWASWPDKKFAITAMPEDTAQDVEDIRSHTPADVVEVELNAALPKCGDACTMRAKFVSSVLKKASGNEKPIEADMLGFACERVPALRKTGYQRRETECRAHFDGAFEQFRDWAGQTAAIMTVETAELVDAAGGVDDVNAAPDVFMW